MSADATNRKKAKKLVIYLFIYLFIYLSINLSIYCTFYIQIVDNMIVKNIEIPIIKFLAFQ